MNEEFSKLLHRRGRFAGQLDENIKKSEEVIELISADKKEHENLIENLKSLKIYPEHESLIPLSKKIYMKGRIVHTGEYYNKKMAHPDSLVVLQSVDQTIKSLEDNVKLSEDEFVKAEYAKFQLEERKRILIGEVNMETDISEMPEEIKSDKGVAVKVGDFYEILEMEDTVESS